MAFQLSPGVNVSEIDLTTVVPSVLTTAGAFAGYFNWGPAGKVTLIDNEINLAKRFGTPDSNSAIAFFTAANFLSYGNNLSLVRSVGANSFNADANTQSTNVQIGNSDVFSFNYLLSGAQNQLGDFVARYPGALGNSLSVEVCANTAAFSTWHLKNNFTSAPGTSTYVSNAGGSNDELHVAVIDSNGLISGVKGGILELYPFLSKATDALNNDNSTNYWKQVIYNKSQYVYAVDAPDYANNNSTWGTSGANKTFATANTIYVSSLAGGTDDVGNDANLTAAYDNFASKETTDISLVITGNASVTVQQHVIDTIVEPRKDCVAFVSPPSSAVVNNNGNEATAINTWLNDQSTGLQRNSSYVVADSGWKYQFDKYNNVYRWIPLNADVAGLCVNTDNVRDPWYSPAGYNRGGVKNAIKLAWNPNKTYRDTIYNLGVNPVISAPGQGIVLFGDKTLLAKPSAFDRINVRRLFIVLEKAVSKAAQYSLFEFNDEFTRAQFVALVTPFLRDIKGRRGITDFKVVCDTTNNTPQVIDSNQFVGDIYIKPARSINFIQLNFVAVGTGVDFTTVVGAV